MTREGYEAYKLYLALQRHFSTGYDYFKYNGKVNCSTAAYEKRHDKWSFEKLTKIMERDQFVDFFVANFIEDPKMWIKNMEKSRLDRYNALYKNIAKNFKQDLEVIKQQGPYQCIEVTKDIPRIYKLVLQNDIKIESVILMDTLFPFVEKHHKEVDIPFVFPEMMQKIEKYRPFVINKTADQKDLLHDIAKSVLLG